MLLIAWKKKPTNPVVFSKEYDCCCCGDLHVKANRYHSVNNKGFMELIFFKSNLCLKLKREFRGNAYLKGILKYLQP